MTPVVRGREGVGSCGEAEKTTIQCEESRVERGPEAGPSPSPEDGQVVQNRPHLS